MSAALKLEQPDLFATVRAVNRMQAAGFSLAVRDSRLIASPFSRLSDSQRAYLRIHKAALVGLLSDAEILHRALILYGPASQGWPSRYARRLG